MLFLSMSLIVWTKMQFKPGCKKWNQMVKLHSTPNGIHVAVVGTAPLTAGACEKGWFWQRLGVLGEWHWSDKL